MESSKQLQRFEELFTQIEKLHSHHFSALSKRLACIKLIEDLTVVREEIEYNIERRKTEALLDIDIDFNYDDIVKNKRWIIASGNVNILNVPNKNRSSFPILKEEVVNREHQKMAISLLNLNEKEMLLKESFDDVRYVDAMLQIGSVAIASEGVLIALVKAAIDNVIEKLKELSSMMVVISNAHCEKLYKDLISGWHYINLFSKVKSEFENWKIKHSPDESRIINEDKLKDYLIECMVELFKADVLKEVDATMSRAEAAKYENDLDFSGMSLDEATCKQQYKLFIELFKRKENKAKITYTPNDLKIGKHLYMHRKTITAEKREALLRFMAFLYLIQKEMELSKTSVKEALDIEAPFNYFKDDYLPYIIKALKEDESKRAWIIAYCEALKQSKYVNELAEDWQKSNKQQQVVATIIAGLVEVGMLPNNNQTAKMVVPENRVRTFAKYIGNARNTEIAEWAIGYVKEHPLP